MVLTNLIPDPTMATGWSIGPNTEQSYQGGQSIKLIGTTSTPEVTVNTTASIPLNPSHIYYARVYGYQTTKTNATVGFYWPIAEPSFQEGIAIKDAGKWQLYSGRTNRSTFSQGNYPFRLDFNNSNIAGTMYFDAPMLIDLTADFGAGNEPSKEWMDSNIPFFIGKYFKPKTGDILNFEYTGKAQSITLPKGVYKLEVWGAQGGTYSSYQGGLGGYAAGVLTVENPLDLFIQVGQQPPSNSSNRVTTNGGYNGGGNGYNRDYSSTYTYGQGGGGATDIRIGKDDLLARVVVAGGGGGSASVDAKTTKYGGGETGGSPVSGYGGTQTTGGSAGTNGTFGRGADCTTNGNNYKYGSGGGGGGWYGGAACPNYSDSDTGYRNQNGGGSGYVYTSATAKNYPTGCLLNAAHYLTEAQNIAGNASMPNPSGGTMTGRVGNGYARITVIKGGGVNLPAKVNGAWKESDGGFVKINGAWKEIDAMFVKVNNTWKELD